MPFYFSLETIQRIRALVEERERRALKIALAECNQQKARLVAADEWKLQSRENLSRAVCAGVVAEEIAWCEYRMDAMQQARAEGGERLRQLDAKRALAMESYFAARRSLETVEHLQAEQFARYRKQVARTEQKLIDDLHLAKLARQKEKPL